MSEIAWDLECYDSKPSDEPFEVYKGHAGVSLACVIDIATMVPTFYGHSDIDGYGLDDLAARIESADRVVSFNGHKFDRVVLSAAIQRPVVIKHHCDLCLNIFDGNGGTRWPKGTWKLDEVCRRTLGVGKLLTDGAFAPTLWRDGRMGELASYVWRDAWLTAGLYKHVREHGWVLAPEQQRVPVRLRDA